MKKKKSQILEGRSESKSQKTFFPERKTLKSQNYGKRRGRGGVEKERRFES